VGEVVNPPFQIGDHYGGGIVIKISDNGLHGYIAALEDRGPVYWTFAEKLCADYRGGGYSDWFFPSSSLVAAMFEVDNILLPTSLHLGEGFGGYIFSGPNSPYEVLSWDTRGGESKCCYGWETESAPVRPVRAF
jgi:hypothetical protein